MFLFFNALVASMDGLIIGINLKLSKIKLSKLNGFIMFITNCLIYTFVLLLYKYFHFTFMTKNISTILYLLLAYMAFKENENEKNIKELGAKKSILLAFTHAIDGTIISLNFVYNYSIIHIITIFSLMSMSILYIGYVFASLFHKVKKGNYISSSLFILLAITNYFL